MFNREHFKYDSQNGRWFYTNVLKSSIWRDISVWWDGNNEVWEVTLEHPDGDIVEHFDTVKNVNIYLDDVFSGKEFR